MVRRSGFTTEHGTREGDEGDAGSEETREEGRGAEGRERSADDLTESPAAQMVTLYCTELMATESTLHPTSGQPRGASTGREPVRARAPPTAQPSPATLDRDREIGRPALEDRAEHVQV